MIKINLICMGDIKEKYLTDAINEYSKRISRFASLKIIELKENVAKTNNDSDILNALKKDATEISKHIKGYPICLDVKGEMISSEQFAKKIEKTTLTNSEITFIIGASNGIHQEIKDIFNSSSNFEYAINTSLFIKVYHQNLIYTIFSLELIIGIRQCKWLSLLD